MQELQAHYETKAKMAFLRDEVDSKYSDDLIYYINHFRIPRRSSGKNLHKEFSTYMIWRNHKSTSTKYT